MTSYRLLAAVALITAAPAAALLPQVPANLLMPAGNAANGQKVFVQCKTCHVTTAGVNRIGPSLAGIVGRKAGTVPKYTYSAANKNSGLVWTPAQLFVYLENPRKVIAGTKMSFAGLKKPQDRADIIAWLKTQK